MRFLARACVAAVLVSTAVIGQTGQADIILFGAKVVTADARRPIAEAVALAGDRIRAVGSIEEIRRLAGVQTRSVNLQGATIIPGLIDAHVHLLIAPQITDEPSLRSYERTALPKVMTGFISHGITTVRSVGDPLPYIVELRDRMNHSPGGPRLVVTGPMATAPGFHGPTGGSTVCVNNPFCHQGVVVEPQNEEQARQAVRELARAKVDAVKIVVDDRLPKIPRLSDSIVAALVDEAHRSELRAIAHMAHGMVVADISAARRLIELGLDEFVHPPFFGATAEPVPDEVSQMANMLNARKVPVTTTVSYFDAYKHTSGTEQAANGGPYTPVRRQTFERLLRILQFFVDAKVRLVVGTDWHERPLNADDPRLMAGARTLHEMEILRRAGLTTTDILTAATRNGAEALGIADKLGTIADGKIADLVILNGDFLQDFSALYRPIAVLKEGRLVHGTLPER
jgi:imidazolonepropionase-like amidohydrolase